MSLIGVMVVSVGTVGSAGVLTIEDMIAGLPDVRQFDQLQFAQPTVVYDRTGTVQLATFQKEQRNVVTFDQLPRLVLDATVATEDHSFWTNPGVNLQATINAAISCYALNDCSRGGGSTITQQLVRARLLPTDLVNDPSRLQERKVKEILQAWRLTDYVEQHVRQRG